MRRTATDLQINRLLPQWMPPDDWDEEHALGFTDHQRFLPPVTPQPSLGRRKSDQETVFPAA